jgi:aminoglycoside 3-N-acetyltransferase I
LRKLLSNDGIADFKDLIALFNEVFENDSPLPQEAYLSKLLNSNNFFSIVAKHNNEVIGGLTVFILHIYYNESPSAYIYDVGVKPSHQGKGIGKSLMAFLCDYCKRNGFLNAYVEAETDDIEAVSFYRKTNFSTEMQATHFTYAFDTIEKH